MMNVANEAAHSGADLFVLHFVLYTNRLASLYMISRGDDIDLLFLPNRPVN